MAVAERYGVAGWIRVDRERRRRRLSCGIRRKHSAARTASCTSASTAAAMEEFSQKSVRCLEEEEEGDKARSDPA
jgi:hypothetical protein